MSSTRLGGTDTEKARDAKVELLILKIGGQTMTYVARLDDCPREGSVTMMVA